jgi:succinate-semialdehyde dehydrogenase / glutarate-semialdehyde dehydrogenase
MPGSMAIGLQGSSRFAVDNPASGEVIAQVSNLGATEAEAAIAAAEAALPAWRAKTAKERSAYLAPLV